MQIIVKTKDTRKTRERVRRLTQVAQWLQANYPAPTRALSIAYVDEVVDAVPGETVQEDPHSLGSCQMTHLKDGRFGFEIQVVKQADLGTEVETLIHEWAHAISHAFTTYQKSQHCDEYWLSYGRMYRLFFEGGGDNASRGL